MRHAPVRSLVWTAVVFTTTAVGAVSQELLWMRDGQGAEYLGVGLSTAGDHDGDGISDLLVGASTRGASAGRVLILRGTDGKRLAQIHEPDAAGDAFGNTVAGGFDLDGDGISDLVVNQPFWEDRFHDHDGRLLVYSGATLQLLYTIEGSKKEHDAFGSSLALLPDLDGDGRAEILGGNPGWGSDYGGRAIVWSGVSGDRLYRWTGNQNRNVGSGVGHAGDLDGDGIDDLYVADDAWDGTVWIRSGATGDEIGFLDGEDGEGFAADAVAFGDANGDGVREFAVGVDNVVYLLRGEVRVFDGATQKLLYSVTGTADYEELGTLVGAVGDANADGVADFVAGAAGARHLTLHSGDDGRPLYRWHNEDIADVPLHIQPLGDVDGDGFADFAFSQSLFGDPRGRVGVFRGNDTYLSVDDRTPSRQNGVRLTVSGRHSFASASLFLVAIDGSPFVRRVAHGVLDRRGQWMLEWDIPSDQLVGKTLEFLAAVRKPGGGSEISAMEPFTIVP